MDGVAQRVLAGECLSRSELLALAEDSDRQGPWELIEQANQVRTARFGRLVRLCSIVPGKLGRCPGDCRWCAQSARSAPGVTPPKQTNLEEIVSAAEIALSLGSANIGIVNSGLRPTDHDLDDVLQAARAIHDHTAGRIGVCASLGELTDAQACRLARSPIRRYHHNLETSRRFFPFVVSTHDYESKLRTLHAARQAGLDICCGGLLGMGETWADRIDLALTLREEVQPDVVPLNFLVAIPETPMESLSPLPPLEILAIIAVFRLALPDVDLKIAGGREANLRNLQNRIFQAGATSCMIGNYLTTAGQTPQEDLRMLADLNLAIVPDFPFQMA